MPLLPSLPIEEDYFWKESEEALAEAVLPVYTDIGVAAADEAADFLYDMGIAVDFDLVNSAALAEVNAHALDLAKSMSLMLRVDAATKIEKWIESKEPLSKLEESLRFMYGETRAKWIASTEVTRAYAAANAASWKSQGVPSMQWVTANDELVCDICGPLDGAIVAMDQNFPGGVFSGVEQDVPYPPAHVQCRCWTKPSFDPSNIAERAEEVPSPEAAPELGITDPDQLLAYFEGICDDLTEDRAQALAYEFERIFDNLPSAQREALRSYWDGAYSRMNAMLRGTKAGDEYVQSLIDDMKASLDAVPRLPNNSIVYRGVASRDLHEDFWDGKYKPGDLFIDKGFSSTTLDPDTAIGWTGQLKLKIFAPSGSDGWYLGGVSTFPEEMEFVLPPGTPITILKIVKPEAWGEDATWVYGVITQ